MKKILLLLLVTAFFVIPAHAETSSINTFDNYRAPSYLDISDNHWAYTYIAYAESHWLMVGDGIGRFHPEEALTEGQCCQIVYNFMATPNHRKNDRWHQPAVDWVKQSWPEADIAPERPATRLFACRLIAKFDTLGKPTITYSHDNGTIGIAIYSLPFTDCGDLTPFDKTAICHCLHNEIISGFPNGEFKPHSTLTRAQAAKIFSLWHWIQSPNNTPHPGEKIIIA